jgi:hypothetical protein
MTDNDSLQRAIDDFYRTLDSMRFQGVSQLAELSQLKVLISKYPEHARKMINERQPPRAGNDSPRPGHAGHTTAGRHHAG